MKRKWYDLTQQFRENMTTTSTLGSFQRTLISDLDHAPCQISRLTFATHQGCHLDAPRHYYKTGQSISDIPVDRLVSRCVVIDAQKGRHGIITVEDVERSGFSIGPGDFVFFYTCWQDYFANNNPMFFEGASLSESLAQWLVDARVGLVGIDTCTVDLAHSLRPKDFQPKIHWKLLENDILIAECLRLNEVVGKELEAVLLPMLVAESDGAPLRAIAREFP